MEGPLLDRMCLHPSIEVIFGILTNFEGGKVTRRIAQRGVECLKGRKAVIVAA